MKAGEARGSTSLAHVVVWAVLICITAISVGIAVWLSVDGQKCPGKPAVTVQDQILIKGARVSLRTRQLSVLKESGSTVLDINLAVNTPPDAEMTDCGSDSDRICLNVNKEHTLSVSRTQQFSSVLCTAVSHRAAWYELEVTDCIDMSGSHWYGSAEVHTQTWPIETWNIDMQPYVPGDSFNPNKFGGVLERYWLSSAGAAVYVTSDDVPLFVSVNSSSSGKLCLMSRFADSPYKNINNTGIFLNYFICQSALPTANFVDLHRSLASILWNKPADIPSESVIRHPIWSTWAMFHENVSQENVLKYAQLIRDFNLSASQLEIDDDWTPKYGDMAFNAAKFPDPKGMLQTLHDLGFNVTLWVHPFANLNSEAFADGQKRGFLLKRSFSNDAALTTWWQGVGGVLDVTNADAVAWFQSKLSNLSETYGVDSFKFDAGETNWLPDASRAAIAWFNPAAYTRAYADLAYRADAIHRRQEVRVGWQTQGLPIFIRMMDKISTWDYGNGLKTLIPSTLTFGLLGYPFVLPDMIGGNAYKNVVPDKELYLRWLEVNALLPSMQFSLAPWSFDAEVVKITRKYLAIRNEWANLLVELSHNATLTGEPIVRPLWWVAPGDETALVVDDQFLVGNDVLVAPVLQQGARNRMVYLPAGLWRSSLTGDTVTGSQWINCSAQLDELPIFTRLG